MPDKGLLQVVRVACNHNISSYFGSKPYEISKISNIQVFDQRIRESVACYDRHGGNLICKEKLSGAQVCLIALLMIYIK